MGRMYVFTAHESRYSHREPWIGAGRPGRRHRRCGIDHDRQYRRQLPGVDRPMRLQHWQRRLQHQPERHPRRIGAGLVEGLQHEYPGYRLSDTHPWRQPEYLADRHRRQHWHQLFHLCRLAEYPVRTGEDRRRRRQRSADARGIRPHPGPGRSEQTLPHRHVGLGPHPQPHLQRRCGLAEHHRAARLGLPQCVPGRGLDDGRQKLLDPAQLQCPRRDKETRS